MYISLKSNWRTVFWNQFDLEIDFVVGNRLPNGEGGCCSKKPAAEQMSSWFNE